MQAVVVRDSARSGCPTSQRILRTREHVIPPSELRMQSPRHPAPRHSAVTHVYSLILPHTSSATSALGSTSTVTPTQALTTLPHPQRTRPDALAIHIYADSAQMYRTSSELSPSAPRAQPA
ncbi:hypothetical protein M422DRAFT_243446 [Sphaerobolus stellatus SS14]|uniref:Uncharacterized protein n=1 Tax=Sphaerobolus stellatus (strain SS14) TaxID=990650 RepID=A0A0C9UHV4_SPHS4|nr:hypothetical protein M422DRAFT_274159 [Sphaerobolus stellatus SS14]KIJ52668.1 hypothetical protein M422DRAFT_243446 [Sphaerobolus stellatus SS14]